MRNLNEFAGMLAVDKWTCNTNGRQAVFWKKTRDKKYTATFIDQGYCFNAGDWTYPDSPLRGVYPRNEVYAGVRGWESFEPWLSRIENFEPQWLWEIAEVVPPEWYGGSLTDIESLLEELIRRRSRVRELIEGFRKSTRERIRANSLRQGISQGIFTASPRNSALCPKSAELAEEAGNSGNFFLIYCGSNTYAPILHFG